MKDLISTIGFVEKNPNLQEHEKDAEVGVIHESEIEAMKVLGNQ